jgi:hypothetical protein
MDQILASSGSWVGHYMASEHGFFAWLKQDTAENKRFVMLRAAAKIERRYELWSQPRQKLQSPVI